MLRTRNRTGVRASRRMGAARTGPCFETHRSAAVAFGNE
jgi:hypothetical protein